VTGWVEVSAGVFLASGPLFWQAEKNRTALNAAIKKSDGYFMSDRFVNYKSIGFWANGTV